MKKFLLGLCLVMCFALISQAQVPTAFNYQAVARDASGNPIVNKQIGVKLSYLNGTTVAFTETFTPTTNAYGMFTLIMGTSLNFTGNILDVDWSSSATAKQLKVEMDPAGGTSYTNMGQTYFYSVPYALVSGRANDMFLKNIKDVGDAQPTTNQVLQYNGTEWAPATIATGGGAVSTDATLTGNGTSGSPLKIAGQSATNGQVLQWNGTSWTPATVSGGVGDNWGTQFVQKNVELSGNGTNASPLRIAQQGAATGESLIWNGTLWTPGSPQIKTSGEFTGQGTTALPLKLSQQGAVAGDALRWNGTTWVPGKPFSLPYIGFGTGGPGLAAFHIQNDATTGNSLNAIDGISAAGIGVGGYSNSATGKGVYGRSDNGIAVYGVSTNGTAGFFDGSVAIIGAARVQGSLVTKASDFITADQTGLATVIDGTAKPLVGLDAVNFTTGPSASVGNPSKAIVTVSYPNAILVSATDEMFEVQIIIKKGATVVKQVNVLQNLMPNGISGLSYTMHASLPDASTTYTASVLLFKGNATGSKKVSIGFAQMQIQVINP